MEKFNLIMDSIDWVFAGVILIGGRYWGSKYFKLSKNAAWNFLGFATAFGVIYLSLLYATKGIKKDQVVNLFITIVVVTSFYELFAQKLFEWIEGLFGKKKETPVSKAITK